MECFKAYVCSIEAKLRLNTSKTKSYHSGHERNIVRDLVQCFMIESEISRTTFTEGGS